MIEKNLEEKYLINLIKNKKYTLEIENVCEIVKTIWSSEVRIVKEYTDHGYEHSQRIIKKIHDILLPFPNILSDTELYFLILGVYLHDIGMQCDIKKHNKIKDLAIKNYFATFKESFQGGTANSYSPEEQNEIRLNHHLLTGAWIEYSCTNNTVLSPFLKMIDSTYIEDLITVCMYHSKLSIAKCPEVSKSTSIRTKLVAALLRFGDELDIDKERVHIETMNEFGYKTENAVFWYLHSSTIITIKNSEIKITVFLSQEDYKKYSSYIDKIYIQSFKSKNKALTDIISRNGINIFISDDSNVEEYRFQNNLPEDIVSTLTTMCEQQISSESKNNINLLCSLSAGKNQNQILELLLGEHEDLNFMQKYKDDFSNKTQILKQLIDKLRTSYNVSRNEIEEAISVMSSLKWTIEANIILDNERAFIYSYNAFLFIRAFTTEQLTFLSDIGVRIPIQVSDGQAQPYANDFFTFYFNNKDNPAMIKESISNGYLFDYYTFEQIGRIVQSYNNIINFNMDSIEFSNCYIYPNSTAGKLLAVSVSGESNKILLWNIESNKHEPIASLGGLFEYVNNIKIYRIKNQTIIAALGRRQIYFWVLEISTGEPTYILKSNSFISDYVIFKSVNEKLYTMGLVDNNIFIWDLLENENPIEHFTIENNIYVINTHLLNNKPSYECIGHKDFPNGIEPKIIELIEDTTLNFIQKLRIDIYSQIPETHKSMELFGYRLNSYSINPSGKEIFLLNNNNISIGNMITSKLINIDNHESQQIIHVKSKNTSSCEYLLTYSIYQQYKESLDLIYCYKFENEKTIDHKSWLLDAKDVALATLSVINDDATIYYSHSFSNKIVKLNFSFDASSEFYSFPKTFSIKDMTSE